jgi:hypothetical protein
LKPGCLTSTKSKTGNSGSPDNQQKCLAKNDRRFNDYFKTQSRFKALTDADIEGIQQEVDEVGKVRKNMSQTVVKICPTNYTAGAENGLKAGAPENPEGVTFL